MGASSDTPKTWSSPPTSTAAPSLRSTTQRPASSSTTSSSSSSPGTTTKTATRTESSTSSRSWPPRSNSLKKMILQCQFMKRKQSVLPQVLKESIYHVYVDMLCVQNCSNPSIPVE